ncbi:hypothetical protein AX774_g3925 [Zancudomyces culisetae]|uniref:Uncharacterized protein n=1 Tax=Zancudomyces culisetae TaxID=1213189 RepID=A0A1R1PNQ7_ZANCU|nr:hypothetical protein AX774_g3925 [Zancudomyces culisetae]|eukprot:OMH82594.1 hypothetical protein AX774_g3925 [Zancudomyces culisetae]
MSLVADYNSSSDSDEDFDFSNASTNSSHFNGEGRANGVNTGEALEKRNDAGSSQIASNQSIGFRVINETVSKKRKLVLEDGQRDVDEIQGQEQDRQTQNQKASKKKFTSIESLLPKPKNSFVFKKFNEPALSREKLQSTKNGYEQKHEKEQDAEDLMGQCFFPIGIYNIYLSIHTTIKSK